MMISNTVSKPKFVGGFEASRSNTGFKNTLSTINEAFQGKQLNFMGDFRTIASSENLNEEYVDFLLEDYETDLANIPSKGMFQDTDSARIRALMENSRDQILHEAMSIGSLGPDVGLSFPMLKIYWIKNIYKDVIPTYVTDRPTWTLGLMQRYCQFEPDGKKWQLPQSYGDPNFSIRGLTKSKIEVGEIKVPQLKFDLLKGNGISRKEEDKLSTKFFITSVKYERKQSSGVSEIKETVVKLRLKPHPANGIFNQEIYGPDGEVIDILTGIVDFDEGYLTVSGNSGCIKSITVDAYLSSENNKRTPHVGWFKKEKTYNVSDNIHITTNYTEELQKDMKAIFNIDAVTDMVQVMEEVLNQDQDQQIQEFLGESKERIMGTSSFKTTTFDFRPPVKLANYTPTEYARVELKETIDKMTERLTHIMYDSDVVISIIGNYHDIRQLDSSISWNVQDTTQMGGCTLNYKFGMYNKHRNYNIMSSDRIPEGELQVLIFPRDKEHMTYKLWQYQTFVTNQYRKDSNSNIPAVTMSNRFLIDEFDPIQGNVVLKNNFDSTTDIYGDEEVPTKAKDDHGSSSTVVTSSPKGPQSH